MNVWILNHYAVSPHSIGGTRHFDLAQQLVRKGHAVTIIASSFNHFNRKETVQYSKDFFLKENIEGVNFIWIKTPPYQNRFERIKNILVFTVRLNKLLSQLVRAEVPDLIIGSSVHPLTPLIGLRKAKSVGSLFYFEERDLWPQTFIEFGMMGQKNVIARILYRLEKHFYRNSDRVIFLFEKAHKYAVGRGLNLEKAIYLPNGFNEDRIQSGEHSQLASNILRRFEEKKVCVYIGSMGEANHMMPLIELADLMKNQKEYHFLFIGDGAEKKSLMDKVEKLKLTNITFHEPIPKKDIPPLLEKAHVGLISLKDSPLYKWGFSMNKLYDYLSAGLPVIMYSNLKDIGDLKKSGGIYNSSSLVVLKGYLLQMEHTNREEIRKYAYENYSWNKLTDDLLTVIENDLKTKDLMSEGHRYYEKSI